MARLAAAVGVAQLVLAAFTGRVANPAIGDTGSEQRRNLPGDFASVTLGTVLRLARRVASSAAERLNVIDVGNRHAEPRRALRAVTTLIAQLIDRRRGEAIRIATPDRSQLNPAGQSSGWLARHRRLQYARAS